MRILVVSDEIVDWIYSPAIERYHGQVDFLVSCGDLPIYYLEYIVSVLNVPAVYVHGNHDSYEVGKEGIIKSEPAGWFNVDQKRLAIALNNEQGKISVAGLQGCMRYKPYVPFQYSQREQKFRAWWLALQFIVPQWRAGVGVDIFVAHSPPYGIHDGVDRAHIGFESFNWLINRFKPKLFLHGHQHRNYAPQQTGETQVGKTRILNCHPWRLVSL